MKYGISNKKGNQSVYCTAPKTLYVYEEKLRKEFNGDFTILFLIVWMVIVYYHY